MTITIGSTFSMSSAVAATSNTALSVTPDAGSNKRVVVVAHWGGTTAATPAFTGATFGGNAMTEIVQGAKTSDPSAVLGAWEYKVGSSTTPGDVVVSCDASMRIIVQAFIFVDVPDSVTPIFTAVEVDGDFTVGLSFDRAGLVFDAFAVNADASDGSNNVLTADAAQTVLRSTTSASGGSTERRLLTSYKSASAGSNSVTTTPTVTVDGELQFAFGYYHDAAGGAVITPADMAFATTFDAEVVAAKSALVPADMAFAAMFDAASLAAKSWLLPADMGFSAAFDAANLTAKSALIPADMAFATTFDAAGVSAGGTIVPAKMVFAATFDEVILAAKSLLSPADMGFATTFDAEVVAAKSSLIPADMAFATTFDAAGVTEGGAAVAGAASASRSFAASASRSFAASASRSFAAR